MTDAPQERIGESFDDTVEFDASEAEPPASIGTYRVLRTLARGGLSCLYEVEGPGSSDRRKVLKVFQNHDPEHAEWFASVASVAKGLDHPNIVPCDFFVSAEERCVIVMPFVDGSDLDQTVHANGLIAPLQLREIVASIARALDYVHGRGVVHGNLHPKKILLDKVAHVWLLGFAEFGPERSSDMIFGNPQHLAPEQIETNTTVPSTDIYALAELSYFCLCGSFPFANHDGAMAILNQKRSGPIPSIRELRPELSKRLDQVLKRGMAIHPDERYSSAGEFAKAFSAALDEPEKRWWNIW